MQQEASNTHGDMTLVALGSNAGNPLKNIEGALTQLQKHFSHMTLSKLYQTPAFPAGFGPDFVNAAVAFHSDMAPRAILTLLHGIEDDFGRTRAQRWGQRTLDLDLIACGDTILPDLATYDHWCRLPLDQQRTDAPRDLILPHPRLQDRLFVLIPLADVTPDWRHPRLGSTVRDMIAAYPASERADIRPL